VFFADLDPVQNLNVNLDAGCQLYADPYQSFPVTKF
jgi:hypothetical protein